MDASIKTIIISSASSIILALIGIWVGLSRNKGDFKLQSEQLILTTRTALDSQSEVIFNRMKEMTDRLSSENQILHETVRKQNGRIYDLEREVVELKRKIT